MGQPEVLDIYSSLCLRLGTHGTDRPGVSPAVGLRLQECEPSVGMRTIIVIIIVMIMILFNNIKLPEGKGCVRPVMS